MKYSSSQLLENSTGLNQCNKINTDMYNRAFKQTQQHILIIDITLHTYTQF